MEIASIVLALAGVAAAAYGVWRVWHLNPEDSRYRIKGTGPLRSPDQTGLREFLQDQKKATAWVLGGTLLQLVSVVLALVAML